MAVIMNPPFGHSLHARISSYIYENWKNANLLVLCPTSLLNGMSRNCIKAREVLKEGFSEFEYEGIQDFGTAKPNVSLFVFKRNPEEKISFEEKQKEFMSDEEISIRKKVEKVDCWSPEKLSKTYNFTIEKRNWDDVEAFRESLKEKLKWSDKKRVFVRSTSAFYYKSVVNSHGDSPSYVAGYFEFKTEEEAEEFRKVVSQPLYNQILKIYSTNKRDLSLKQSKWPKSIDSLNLTKEEIEWLNML